MSISRAFSCASVVLLLLWVSACDQAQGPGPIDLDCDQQPGVIRLVNRPSEVVDYRINCPLIVGENEELIIEAGTIIEMGPAAYIQIEARGKIKAIGNALAPIIIRGQGATSDFWRGLVIASDFSDNTLQYVELSDGGDWWNVTSWGLLQLWGNGSLAMDHCTIRNTRRGVNVFRSMRFSSFTENVIQDCEEVPMNLDIIHLNEIPNSNSFIANGQNYLEVRGGVLTEDQTWRFNAIPISLTEALVDSGITLTIQPGVNLLMGENQFIVDGTLKVQGTADQPVSFNGLQQDQAGFWQGIAFNSPTEDNIINHAVISGGGAFDNFSSGNIILYAGGLEVSNTLIKHSATCGIRLLGNIIRTNSNTFENNAAEDVCQ